MKILALITARGAFYLASPEQLKTKASFYGGGMIPLIMDQSKVSRDIDTG